MLCIPKKTIDAIIKSGNHYIAQVKGNQGTLHKEILQSVEQDAILDQYIEEDKSHGRHVIRETKVFDANSKNKTKYWTSNQAYIVVRRKNLSKGQTETACYMSDIRLSAEAFHIGIKEHWGIENKLHWVKDVVHKEDKNKIKAGSGPLAASIFSTIALNIHRTNGNRSITNGQIKFRAIVEDLFGFLRT